MIRYRKEGYSIILQGQIDKILSGKPEVCGAFLTRRQVLLNLNAVKLRLRSLTMKEIILSVFNDILSELEKQVDSLQVQSES